MPTPFAYDDIAYPGMALPQAAPDRLATIGTLHGLQPAPVDRCRYLEIGCGDARHLAPLAHTFPNSTFVGMDLSAAAIARGQTLADDLLLKNLQLEQADLMAWSAEGQFDFVIAHGFYSWVPDVVRDRLLALAAESLAPHGILYVSYNCLPGGHIRRMMREILLHHVRGIDDPKEQIRAARELLEVLAVGPKIADDRAAALRAEAKWMLDRGADFILFHDDLAPCYHPVTVTEFAAHAGRHGLAFVAEADYTEMHLFAYPPNVRAALAPFDGDVIQREQYRDFVKCRRFRQTLLCRQAAAPSADALPDSVRHLGLASDAAAKSANPNFAADVAERFASPRGPAVQLAHPLTKAALVELASVWPRYLKFDDMVQRATGRLAARSVSVTSESIADFAGAVVQFYMSDLCDLSTQPPTWASTVGEKPLASPVARAQLKCGDPAVASLRHDNVRITDLVLRELLGLLDGTRGRGALLKELEQAATAGRLKLPAGTSAASLRTELDRVLNALVADALLVE